MGGGSGPQPFPPHDTWGQRPSDDEGSGLGSKDTMKTNVDGRADSSASHDMDANSRGHGGLFSPETRATRRQTG